MININSEILIKETLVSEVAILTVQYVFGQITKDEFKKYADSVARNKYFSETIIKLGLIAAKQIEELINEVIDDGEDSRVVFADKITIKNRDKIFEEICDVSIITNKRIRAIKIVSMEYDFIEAGEYPNLIAIGCGLIEKHLTKTAANDIELVVIQPNLSTGSIVNTTVEELTEIIDSLIADIF